MNVHIHGAFSLSKVNYVCAYKKFFSTIFIFLNDNVFLLFVWLILGAIHYMFIGNKVMIVTAGAIPLLELFKFENSNIMELAMLQS
jgi:hypothetical protein